MRQFLISREIREGSALTLGGRDFHYLTRVLRMRVGDEVPAVDAAGSRFTMRIASVGHSDCRVELAPLSADGAVSARGPVAPSSPAISLMQCLPKGRKMDLIVRQAAEAGVARILPLTSEHSLRGHDSDVERLARWRRIAREALQQSGNSRLPDIEPPAPLPAVLRRAAEWDLRLLFHQERVSRGGLHDALFEHAPRICLLIGPEGGLSEAEVRLLVDGGFRPVFLGDAVLRVETAALYAIGAVRTILQEKDAWTLSRRS